MRPKHGYRYVPVHVPDATSAQPSRAHVSLDRIAKGIGPGHDVLVLVHGLCFAGCLCGFVMDWQLLESLPGANMSMRMKGASF